MAQLVEVMMHEPLDLTLRTAETGSGVVPVTPALGRWRQKGQKVKDIFGLIASLKPREANLGDKRPPLNKQTNKLCYSLILSNL